MTRLSIHLEPSEHDAMWALSQRERRDPRDQAALIIRNELERLGYIQPPKMEAANAKTNTKQPA